LGDQYTLAAIDLPFHGKTTWNEGLLMAPGDLVNIINAIIEQPGDSKRDFRFSLLGFSLGGRIALHLIEAVPSHIARAVLIAPDGLRVNFWYAMGTQTRIGNRLFSYTMRKPDWFFSMINLACRVGLISKSILKFTHSYLDDENERLLLYERWTTLRKFKPTGPAVNKAIRKHDIRIRILFGSYDRIIVRKRGAFFNDSERVKVSVIEAGHMLLRERYARNIASLFSQ
jgi:pimeloyl-ACP methyl ester carboxylesterase